MGVVFLGFQVMITYKSYNGSSDVQVAYCGIKSHKLFCQFTQEKRFGGTIGISNFFLFFGD